MFLQTLHMGIRLSASISALKGIYIKMTDLWLSPDEGLGPHVKAQVKSGRQRFVAELNISATAALLFRFLNRKGHKNEEWQSHSRSSHSYSHKWHVFYVSIYIGSAMITSHSLVNVISLSLSSWSSPYDIPPGQFPVLRPYYHQLKLQRHAELQIWFQIRKISVHPEGRMRPCQRISFTWEVLKAGIRMRDKVNHVIYFYRLVFMHRPERKQGMGRWCKR